VVGVIAALIVQRFVPEQDLRESASSADQAFDPQMNAD